MENQGKIFLVIAISCALTSIERVNPQSLIDIHLTGCYNLYSAAYGISNPENAKSVISVGAVQKGVNPGESEVDQG
jgi:hypothetical protein